MKQTVTAILILFCLTSCTRTIKSRIDAKMKYMNCETDTCIIRMTDLFSFEWDTMFVYEDQQTPTGDYSPNLTIYFVKDSHIVYKEFHDVKVIPPFDFEPYPVEFYYGDMVCTPDNAVFLVEKKSYKKPVFPIFEKTEYYFFLTPVDSLDTIRQKREMEWMKIR